MALLNKPTAPALPTAEPSYTRQFFDQYSKILRLYFNRIDSIFQIVLGYLGGAHLSFPNGSFFDTTNQRDGNTSIPYAMRLNSTVYTGGVRIDSRQAVFTGSIAATTLTVTAMTSGRLYPAQLIYGAGVSAGSYSYLQMSSTATATATPTFVSGGAVGTFSFVLSSVAGIEDRYFVSGTGVPANTRVISVDTVTKTVTLAAAFTVQAAGTYTFRPWGYEGTYSVSPSQTVSSTLMTGDLPSLITVEHTGIFNFQFSAQFTNPDTQAHDVDVWLKYNGESVPDSNTVYTVPSSHGGVPGRLGVALNYFQQMVAGDYIEIVWRTSDSQVYIEYIPPQTNPIRPAVPSVILTATFVSNTMG